MKSFIAVFFLIFANFCFAKTGMAAVTYTFSGGRFGDNLLSYAHAKWIAYQYNIPLLYKPFDYSDQLRMHQLEVPYCAELVEQFCDEIVLTPDNLIIDPASDILYVVPFFPESIFNRYDREFPYLFTVEWENPQFKAILQQMISPVGDYSIPLLPQDCVTVAVHVRRGTGWDIPNYRITPKQLIASHPLRFAPDSFFIEQLQVIAQLYTDRKIYVYVFTDHDNPQELAYYYQKEVGCERMLFDCRRSENNEFINVLDDFFALTHFDCLIRSDSNFSYLASKLGNYCVVLSPWHGMVTDEDTIIDEVCIEIGQKTFIMKENKNN